MGDDDVEPIGWGIYFPGEEWTEEDPRAPYLETLITWLGERFNEGEFAEYEFDPDIPLDWGYLKNELPSNLLQLVEDRPADILSCLGLAYYQLVYDHFENVLQHPKFKNRRIYPRIFNYKPIIPLRNIKSNLIGKFVAITGTVIRAGAIKPLVTQMSFKCVKCESDTIVYFKEGKYKYPTKCNTAGCRSKNFIPMHETANTIDWQQIRIQESMDRKDPGRVPRTIEVELSESLVDTCVPGDTVTICGEVKVIATEPERGKKNGEKSKALFLIYLEANSLDNSKQIDIEGSKSDISSKDINAIMQISQEPNLYKLITNSICPSIYGHEMVKGGIALTIFGGSNNKNDSKQQMSVRGNPHLLIVGDPGLGKSQMLTAINYIVPRGVYVCGSYSSATGLTVSILRESGSGDYAIEAGALVLGDQGVCCIDEFDKMPNEHIALMEAMEQQSISIAKAGIVCNLLARTSIIAAANPVGGHYNKSKSVCDNLKMDSALLSRFDLIFILLDKPDEERDQLISDHVMSLHEDPHKSINRSQFNNNNNNNSSSQGSYLKTQSNMGRLVDRLKVNSREAFEPIHPIILRKYIAFARKHVHPVLTPEACTKIQQFYLELRSKNRSNRGDSTPITTRQLESIVRLSQARARLELRNEVSEQDALDVIEIMKDSLFDKLQDNLELNDFRTIGSRGGKSKEFNRYVARLQKLAEENCQVIWSSDELQKIAKDMGINYGNFNDFLSKLNTEGYLLSKGNKQYKLSTIQ